MSNRKWLNDYAGVHFDEGENEVGFGVGAPILDHEIRKQPVIVPKWTKYDQQQLHGFHLNSIGSNRLVLGASFRRVQFIDWIGGRKKSGETNCDGLVGLRLFVNGKHQIASKQPVIGKVKCTSSGFGWEQLIDHFVNLSTFLISGGKDQFGIFDMFIGIGSLAHALSTMFADPLVITDSIQRKILGKQFVPYVERLWKLKEGENEVFLSDIRYDPKGIWFVFSYPQWLEDAVRSTIKLV